jgi:hypothetical protein
MKNLVEIHPKAQRHYRALQQKLCNVSALRMKRVHQRQSKDKPAEERDRRRNHPASRQDHAYNEYCFVHGQSLACQPSAFQEQMPPISDAETFRFRGVALHTARVNLSLNRSFERAFPAICGILLLRLIPRLCCAAPLVRYLI